MSKSIDTQVDILSVKCPELRSNETGFAEAVVRYINGLPDAISCKYFRGRRGRGSNTCTIHDSGCYYSQFIAAR